MIEVTQGVSPLVLGLPHTGTDVPPEIWADLNANGQILADTDWHIHDIYSGLVPDLTTVRTPIHRYVIDVNRDPARSISTRSRTRHLSAHRSRNHAQILANRGSVTDLDEQPASRRGGKPA